MMTHNLLSPGIKRPWLFILNIFWNQKLIYLNFTQKTSNF